MNFAQKLSVVFSLTLAMMVPAAAQALNTSDMAFTFGSKAVSPETRISALTGVGSARGLNQAEMIDTEGAVAPLVAVGIMTGARFIAQRYVSQRVATGIVSRGGNVMAANRSQAAAIARNASNGQRPIREFHPGPGQRFTHYHTHNRNGGHVWYGRPR
jgi:hypothetical protein